MRASVYAESPSGRSKSIVCRDGVGHAPGHRPPPLRPQQMSAFVLKDLALLLGPLIGQSTEVEPSTDDEFSLTDNLRLNAVLPLIPELRAPDLVAHAYGPQLFS
jgi:hypothetical protein